MFPLALFNDVGGGELMVVAVVALLLFGKEMPTMMRKFGRMYANFKRQLSDASAELQREMNDAAYLESCLSTLSGRERELLRRLPELCRDALAASKDYREWQARTRASALELWTGSVVRSTRQTACLPSSAAFSPRGNTGRRRFGPILIK